MGEEEIWSDIPGFENKYQASTNGQIGSLNYNNTGKFGILKQKINKRTGQCEVRLSKDNVAKDYMVARLVAETYIPNPLFKDEVMHISKEKTDNSVGNLEWAYKSETRHHMYNKGSRKNGKATKTKISYKGKNYKRYSQIAKELGINQKTFYTRMYLGWNLWEALEVPVGKRGENDGEKEKGFWIRKHHKLL